MERKTENNVHLDTSVSIMMTLPMSDTSVGVEFTGLSNDVVERTENSTPDTPTNSASIVLTPGSGLSTDQDSDQEEGSVLLNGNQGNTATDEVENSNNRAGNSTGQFSEGDGSREWLNRTSEPLLSTDQQLSFGLIRGLVRGRAIPSRSNTSRVIRNVLPVHTTQFLNQEFQRRVPSSILHYRRRQQADLEYQQREERLNEHRQIRWAEYREREQQAFDQREVIYDNAQHDRAIERDAWSYFTGSLEELRRYNNNPTILHAEFDPAPFPGSHDPKEIDAYLKVALGLSDDPAYRYPDFGYE